MQAPVTVVIPTLDAETSLPRCIEALMPGLVAGLIGRLVISDGGSGDGTCAMADALGATLVRGAPGRGGQIARGIAAAPAGWVLVLHADTHLSEGWIEAVETHFAGGAGQAGWFRLAFRARGAAPRLVAGWANLRARYLGLPYGDQGLLVHTDLLARQGGYPELPLMEDVALARALRGRLVPLEATARTSAARYLRDGWLRRGAANLWTLARYLAGADPARLARSYQRR